MDKLVFNYAELVALSIDLSALPVSDPSWFSIQPDDSTAEYLKKQRMICRQLQGGLRIGVEITNTTNNLSKPAQKSTQTTTVKTKSVKGASGQKAAVSNPSLSMSDLGTASTLIPFIGQNPVQVFTFTVELETAQILSLVKDPASTLVPPGLPPGQRLLFTNSKKGGALQPGGIPIARAAFPYIPQKLRLTKLEVQNAVTGEVTPQPVVPQGSVQSINTSAGPAGLYHVLEDGAVVSGAAYYQRGQNDPRSYAYVMITTSPNMLNAPAAERLFTLNFNPK